MALFSSPSFIAAIALAFGVAAAAVLPENSHPGFERIGEFRDGTRAKIYFASTFPANQDDALKACNTYLNGRLATVLSRAEFDAIARGLPPSGTDYSTYFIAGRKVGGSWFWLTLGEVIDKSLLFWDATGIYPIGQEGQALAMRKYANSVPSYYTDSWGPTAVKKYVCEVNSE